jgi:hypothetical protein
MANCLRKSHSLVRTEAFKLNPYRQLSLQRGYLREAATLCCCDLPHNDF